MDLTVERHHNIREIQAYCADLLEAGQGWSYQHAEHVARLLCRDPYPWELFRFMDERTGDSRVGYRTRDGREWMPYFRQMRNQPGSGLFENLPQASPAA